MEPDQLPVALGQPVFTSSVADVCNLNCGVDALNCGAPQSGCQYVRRLRVPAALVVDDDRSWSANSFRARSPRRGFAVESCGDGRCAVDVSRGAFRCRGGRRARMPKLPGWVSLQTCDLPAPSTAWFCFSGMDDAKTRRDALSAGAVAYLVKPASSQAIVDAATGQIPAPSSFAAGWPFGSPCFSLLDCKQNCSGGAQGGRIIACAGRR